ncbi:hypothetical protein L5515_009239 [Caenorhabditis briggsae]|uniref:Uncharacterized protein n=1 Tax=Caenorhabditis briggsae TaxID=6238 RepID=A0AAE9F997_CAEBR|nr:hypothetical protein L5515_009239 [Caenorhabditis briggsae]
MSDNKTLSADSLVNSELPSESGHSDNEELKNADRRTFETQVDVISLATETTRAVSADVGAREQDDNEWLMELMLNIRRIPTMMRMLLGADSDLLQRIHEQEDDDDEACDADRLHLQNSESIVEFQSSQWIKRYTCEFRTSDRSLDKLEKDLELIMSVQKEQPKVQVEKKDYEEENTNSPSSILESSIPESLLSLKEKIIGPPKTRKVQKSVFEPSAVDLDELYPPTCKFVVSCCKSCHGFRAGLGVLRTDEYKCPNCKHASEGLMAFATLEEGIWFKNYLILMDLYQKLQSRLQMAILDEGSFKSHFIGVCSGFYRNWLRSVDMVPVPEICGFTNHLRITQDWNFQPNMKEWVMCEPSTEMPKL